MGSPVPTTDTVTAAVNALIFGLFGSSIPAGSEVFNGRHRLEDDGEELYARQTAQAKTDGELDAFYIHVESPEAPEGLAPGESYQIYEYTVEHWNVRTNNAGWFDAAKDIADVVATAIANAPSVFAILGQRQLRTAQTVTYDGYTALAPLESTVAGAQQWIIQGFIRFRVEARRFS